MAKGKEGFSDGMYPSTLSRCALLNGAENAPLDVESTKLDRRLLE